MSEKLSERLLNTLKSIGAVIGSPEDTSIRDALSVVRAVELAPACVVECVCDFDESEQAVLNVLVKNGKRVKLVEVK